MINFLLFTIFTIIFSGCFEKQPPISSQTFAITIISPMIKINDVGFIHHYKNNINLQIYSSAINTANIKIDDQICINRACFEKIEFNKKFFLNEHYDAFFEDILTRNKIYNGVNFTKSDCGFTQNISKNFIKYEVCGNNIKFIDTTKNIKIIIKELK
ncbi:hypothetical protein KDD93_08035 [Campylobacter sp. faydin G-24]|uniref:Lipoprotein n=1 Tax=Campylobacter anatolicus TaxID=2829105 RepID=A0ABS5HKJ1_9BACT|nr:hypothetical protein [Campylobacter anatolicus]MBR8464510.1 hypothetical protein [Campylobacter anatolicus]MBR8466277.1 hypothetical protein [Campylobacter anatolicus]